MRPNLLIIGHARHGKDTLAEVWREHFDLQFQSSSYACAEIFIFDALKDKHGYATLEECFEDRVNHRAEWFDLISGYNRDDKARLGKAIVAKTGCYVGMRSDDEIQECISIGLFNLIVWVDARERLPLESPDSFNISIDCADMVIQNNGTELEFMAKAYKVGRYLLEG